MAFINEYPYSDFNEYNMDWIIKTIKDLTTEWADMQTSFSDLDAAFISLKNYVDNYFEDLDLQEQVNIKLNEMAESGELTDLMAPLLSDAISDIPPLITQWLDDNIVQETGYVLDKTLTTADAAADANITGQAVYHFIKLESGAYQDANGKVKAVQPARVRNVDPVPLNDIYELRCPEGYLIFGYVFDETMTKIGSNIQFCPSFTKNLLPPNARFANFYIRDRSNSSADLTGLVSDIEDDFVVILESRHDIKMNEENVNTMITHESLISPDMFIFNDFYLTYSTGIIAQGNGNKVSDFINVSNYSTLYFFNTQMVTYYDADYAFISGEQLSFNVKYTKALPANTAYVRVSTSDAHVSDCYITPYDLEYPASYDNAVVKGLSVIASEDRIVVDKNGGGDYTSLTEALFENVNKSTNIIVRPGTYDIETEYNDFFGSDNVNAMEDTSDALFNGFQFGIVIRNKNIKFDSGAKITCDWSGHTVNGSHRFSAIRVDYNNTIDGLDLTAIGTYYAIHDDYGLSTSPYRNEYKNCIVNASSLYNTNCIGGGCKKYSFTKFENCYFNNNAAGTSVRYHNTNIADAEPKMVFANCYFNNALSLRWYGSQVTKMTVLVNNCKATQISKSAENSSAVVDNVDLIKWNNEEN